MCNDRNGCHQPSLEFGRMGQSAPRKVSKSLPLHFGSTLNGDKANVDGDYPFGTGTKGPDLKRTTAVDDPKYPKNAFGL